MIKKNVEKLSKESFEEFGYFADLISPRSNRFGESPIEFYPDMLQAFLPDNIASLSSVVVSPRPFVVDSTEFHGKTCEATLPLNGDILIHAAPPVSGAFPAERVRIFHVPAGTLIVLKPGVWHGAPFAAGEKEVSSLVLLPVRAYANDCFVYDIPEDEQIVFETGGAL